MAALAERSGLSGSVAANWIADNVADARKYQKDFGPNKTRRDPPPPEGAEIPRDWSNVMGGGVGITATGSGRTRTYPAKFAFTTSGKDCVNDFVVYTTSAAGATSSGNRYQTTGTFTAAATAGDTFTIVNSSIPLIWCSL